MFKNLNDSLRKNAFTIAVLSIICLGLYSYFSIYIPGKEATIHADNFRVLTRLNQNINQQTNAFIKQEQSIKDQLSNHFPEGLNEIREYQNGELLLTKKKIENYLHQNFYYPDRIKFSLETITYKSNPGELLNLYNSYSGERRGDIKGDSIIQKDDVLSDAIGYYYDLNDQIEHDSAFVIKVSWDWGSFMKNLLHDDFDYYLVLDHNNRLIYSNSSESGVTVPEIDSVDFNKIISSTRFDVKRKIQFDSLLTQPPPFKTSVVSDLKIGGKPYKLYMLPVENFGNKKLTLCGLVPTSKFNSESHSIPSRTSMIIIFVAIIFIMSMPFIKLILLSPIEKLSSNDLIFSMASIMFAVIISTLLVLFIKEESRQKNEFTKPRLKSIADFVGNNFRKNLADDCKLLQQSDSILFKDTLTRGNLVIADDHMAFINNWKHKNQNFDLPGSYKMFTENAFQNKDFVHLFWIDSAGNKLFTWTKESNDTIKTNVADRDYFNVIAAKKFDKQFRLSETDSLKFFMKPILSYTTGTLRTVISKKSLADKKMIVCLTMKTMGLDEFLMPPGYGYAIVNEEGDVYYSSDKTKNLNENIIDELEDGSDLTAAIHARTEQFFTTDYHKDQFEFRVSPVPELPFYLVVWHRTIYDGMLMNKTMMYSFAALCVVLFLIIVLGFIIVVMRTPKPGEKLFKINLEWMWPLREKIENYNQAMWFNTIVIILLGAFTSLLFECNSQADNFSGNFIYLDILAVFSIMLHTFYQFKNVPGNRKLNNDLRNMLVISVIGIGMLLITAYHFRLEMIYLISFISCLLITFFVIHQFRPGKRFTYSWIKPVSIASAIFITWIIVVCVIPSSQFLKIGFDYEKLQQLKNYQSHLVDKLKVNSYKKNSLFGYDVISRNDSLPANDNELKTDWFYNLVIANIGFAKSKEMIDEKFMYNNYSYPEENKLHEWHLQNDTLYYNCKAKFPVGSIDNIIVKSNFRPFMFFGEGRYFVSFFLLTILILIVLLFLFIRFIITKYFIIQLPRLDPTHGYLKEILLDNNHHRQIFINGVPGTGKLSFIQNALKQNEERYIVLDMRDLPDVEIKDFVMNKENIMKLTRMDDYNYRNAGIIVIRHFEYNFKNRFTSWIKINLLESLITDSKKVIVLSEIHPVTYLQSSVTFDFNASAIEKQQMMIDRDRWASLLGSFINYYYHKTTASLQAILIPDRYERHAYFIRRECRFGTYLNNLSIQLLTEEKNKISISKEQLMWKIQSRAQYYYQNLWSSFTKEEQYLIYDIAQDGIINTKNYHVLKGLYLKGILINDQPVGKLALFNKSFGNFIRTEVNKNDITEIEKGIRADGKWSSLRTPLVIIIITLVIFFITTQQQSYNNILTYLSLFVTGATLFQKVIGIFDLKGSKPMP